jgi:hypothetical protein
MKLQFSQYILKYTQISNFMTIYPVRAIFFPYEQTYRQTDNTKVIVAFGNFANTPNMILFGLLL